jgi:maltooligosyltrehalose trehalohydrolase
MRVVTGDGNTTRYVPLAPEPGGDGFLQGRDEQGKAGDLYWIQLGDQLLPDPASRFQPRGVDGPSQVIDPGQYNWRTVEWQRPTLKGRVIYELHVGTFTPEGTFSAAVHRLRDLAELGVNTLELMPLGDFPGGRNWGYDGVMINAPARCYGTPDELRAFIDEAHALGLAVMVDVVYNHLGPCGNVLPAFSPDYFHRERGSIWGAGLNFDGPNSGPVRQFFLQNVCMWLDEYHVDGLRLDAVHAIHDRSDRHLVADIAAVAHARGAFVVAEDERNDAQILAPLEERGWGVDGVWADDFHHVMRVAVTRQQQAHFANYSGSLQEWIVTLRDGWFYHGQYFRTWRRERGTPAAHLPPEKFVFCISNHDQVGNRPLGDRLSDAVSPDVNRAVSMLLCLSPYTPLLFMGQEWAARAPFPFFGDLPGEVGANMAMHRRNEFRHYGATYPPEVLERMPDPQAEATFLSAKLDWSERERGEHAAVLALYRECLRWRAAKPAFHAAQRGDWSVEQAGPARLAVRWKDEWLLLLALSAAARLEPEAGGWELALSSNEPRFGGTAGSALAGPGAALWRRVR